MSTKEILSFLSVIPDKSAEKIEVQEGNIFFKGAVRRRAITQWDTNTAGEYGAVRIQPWKMASLLVDDDETVGHASIGGAGKYVAYPSVLGSDTFSTYNYSKFRATAASTTLASTAMPRVIGSVGNYHSLGATELWQSQDNLVSLSDVPLEYTQIGIVYQHPMFVGGSDLSTTTGASYVTVVTGHYLELVHMESHVYNVLVIGSGADAGMYFVRHADTVNHRLYLMNLDGSLFVGQATASSIPWYTGPGRRAYFNETSILQLSTGLVVTGGTFRPGAARSSFILRVTFDKSGSDVSAAGTEQQGRYYVSLRPYTHGSGLSSQAADALGLDVGRLGDTAIGSDGSVGAVPYSFKFFAGGAVFALDEVNQRVWFGYTNSSNQSGIGYWRWKTNEACREIANYLGTAAHSTFVSPSIVLGAGDIVRDFQIGSAGVVYASLYHASGGNGGIVVIKADKTTLQYNTGSLISSAASQVAGTALDSTRSRIGTASDVSTNGVDQVTSASGAFTNADIGRVIKLTGLRADSGTYKISTIVGGTQVTVVTLADGVVTFTSQSGGTFEIGERLYLFFNNATIGVGKINYMESLVPGTFLTRTVSMTNGANCNVANRYGEKSKTGVDPATGDIYWLSNDTQQQVNKYTVLTNAHTFRTVANVQSPPGGTGTIGTITAFTAILVNPKFDEIWVGTDQGEVKLVKSDFAGANYKRYFGAPDGTYANPTGFLRPGGWSSTITLYVRNFLLHPDGKVSAVTTAGANSPFTVASYSREADLWNYKENCWTGITNDASHMGNFVFDSIGNYLYCYPHSVAGNSTSMFYFGNTEVQYQWDAVGAAWIPLEVYQGALPNKSATDTIAPGCRTKPIHAGLEDVLYGVKIGFTKQGGATPPNNEFLGRAGQTTLTMTDGATSIGLGTFAGSGFVSGDVGHLLRIESGVDAGVYKITVYNSPTSLTVAKLNSVAFSAGATASGLSYTIWTRGSPGSNAGPETASVLLADGFGKDNTQDISGITYEQFHFKTIAQESVEGTKFCVSNPIGVPGGLGMKVYYDWFPRVGTAVLASHDLQTTQIRALPAAEWTSGGYDGSKLVDSIVDAILNNAGARGSMYSSPGIANIWYGTVADAYGFLTPVSSNLGNCPMVDLGADAEVGYIIIRGNTSSATNIATYTAVSHGLKATLYKANGPTAPVASSTSRTSGTSNLSLTINISTITTTGDFLGSVTTGPFSDGSAVAGQSTFNAPSSTFVAGDIGKVLKITSIGDVGAYRIIAVDGTGAIATVTNLDQTAKAWAVSVSSIVYEVRDGVREEDVICVPSIASPTQRLCIERLLSPTTAQVRVPPHTSASTQSWQCAIPTWDKVKRVSYSTEALPPDVANNKTWVGEDGREQNDFADFKIHMDLTDLSVAQRTGRWWQLQTMPRGAQISAYTWNYSTFEFYSPAGARLGVSQNTFSDNSLQNADFLSQHINRLDFIQSSYLATGIAGFNGVADLGGSNGDTVTLPSGTNKFLGFQVRRPFSDGVCIAGLGGNFTSATAVFLDSDVGRFLRLTTGVNAGIYRIATRGSATAVTLTLPSGTAAPSFTGTSGKTFTLHEGISAGGVAPDRLVFLDDLTREYRIATISDDLTTLTITDARQSAMVGKNWEIRRPAFDTAATAVDSTKLARLVRPGSTYPLQPGDVVHDSRGALRFWANDIGSGNSRSDGSITGGDGVFVGSGFCADDVGRLLYITTGVTGNQGIWRISVYSSATTVTVVNAYTGAAVTFSADATADKVYKIYGDRRFKIVKHVTTLRA